MVNREATRGKYSILIENDIRHFDEIASRICDSRFRNCRTPHRICHRYMKALRFNLDFIVIAIVIASFLFVASQRLATVPVPEGDEAYMMQVTYEMLYRHKVAVPMMRYLGGNIENAWHSRTPIYFLLMIGFHKLAGFGLFQARIFNLLTAAATLAGACMLAVEVDPARARRRRPPRYLRRRTDCRRWYRSFR